MVLSLLGGVHSGDCEQGAEQEVPGGHKVVGQDAISEQQRGQRGCNTIGVASE